MKLKFQLVSCFLALVFGSSFALIVLNKISFDRFLKDASLDSAQVTAVSMRNIYTDAYWVGLAPAELSAASATIERVLTEEPSLRSASVYVREGETFRLYYSNVAVERTLPADVVIAIGREPNAKSWRLERPDELLSIIPIINPFEQKDGFVIVAVDMYNLAKNSTEFVDFLVDIQIIIFFPISTFILFGTLWVARPVLQNLQQWLSYTNAYVAAKRGAGVPPNFPETSQDDLLQKILREPFGILSQNDFSSKKYS